MIIVQLAGGLGNQMFQYAAGRCLAQHHGVEVKLDLDFFASQNLRSYQLDAFCIREAIAAREEVQPLTGSALTGRQRLLFRLRQAARPPHRRSVVVERRKHRFDPLFLKAPRNAYLVGYWQNETYFAPLADDLRAEFGLRAGLSPASEKIAGAIAAGESVGVHVRRGDYATVEKTRRRHGVCTPAYYHGCAAELNAVLDSPHYFIFSDDPAWARDNLRLGSKVTVVDHTHAHRDQEDLALLSRCRHFILANSTFSWWAVWLAGPAPRLVYAPQKWFARRGYDTRDFVPTDWKRR